MANTIFRMDDWDIVVNPVNRCKSCLNVSQDFMISQDSIRMTKVIRIIARLNVGGPAKHVVWLTAGLRAGFDTVLVAGSVPEGEEDMSYFAEKPA